MLYRFVVLTLFFGVGSTQIFAESTFCANQKTKKLVFCQDFQQSTPGLYTNRALKKDWPGVRGLSNKRGISHLGIAQERVAITPLSPNKVLDVRYPKGKFGPLQTGATWIVQLPRAYEQLSLEYKVMFQHGFLFDRDSLVASAKLIGGKLPGLMGGKSISGHAKANGINGWTARIMWGQQGRGLSYLYYPDMRDHAQNKQACPRYGQNTEKCKIYRNKYFTYSPGSGSQCISEWPEDKFEFKFKAGRFYKIKQHLKMNTVQSGKQGKRDGVLKIWVDDKLVLNCNNIRYRDTPKLAIDALLFNTFFGGNTAESSAHPRDERIYFDDVVVSY